MKILCKGKTRFNQDCASWVVQDGYCFDHHPEPHNIIRQRIKMLLFKKLTDSELDFLFKKIKEENVRRFRENMSTPIN